ncbi:MAG: hypothetical protein EPN85_00700 [Bacteroidetes bacterium]|nr:MAG: hypothetical protein EPN85_00700 [Bacteroidota bacterium]
MFEFETIKDKVVLKLDTLRSNKKIVYHTSILFFSQLIVIVLGFLTKGIQTRALTPENYGLYAFFTTLTGFFIFFFSIGLYPTMEVLLASNKDKQKEKELLGASFILTFILGILFSIFLFAISFFIDDLFHIEFGSLLRLLVPLCIAFPFRLLIPSLAIGSGKIEKVALFDFLCQLFFSLALVVLFFFSTLNVMEIMLLNLLSALAAVVYIIFRFQPSFKNFPSRFNEIKSKNKEYGWHCYIGSVFSETSYRLDEIFITYFINATHLGFYSLANIICSPMVMLSSALSSALFKRFSDQKKIPPMVFIFNMIWIIISLSVLYFLSEFVVRILFGDKFSSVADYVMPLSVAYVLKTLYQPYSFLAAKSKGREIRNVAVAEGIVSIMATIIFIPLWGVMGAIYASILARVVDAAGLSYYYKKYLEDIKNKS